jgi:hypothetical protein
MQIQKKSMYWFHKPSAWDYSQSLNAKRKAQAQSYIADQTNLANSLTSINASISASQTDLAIRVAIDRIQSKKKA